jgi:CHAD domain-containing protein
VDTTSIIATSGWANAQVTLADYIYPAIQKQYVAILTHEADIISGGDPEAVHQMRVSLRRLRSQLRAFAPLLDLPAAMGDKAIGKIAKILGKVRDLDVLEDTCKTYQVNLPESEQLHLDEVLLFISKRRRKAIVKVQLMTGSKEYQLFKLSVNNWLNNAYYTQTVRAPIQEILPDLMLPAIGQLFLNPGWWIDIDLSSESEPESAILEFLVAHGTVLHNLRKQVKAVRYLMELFSDRYIPRYGDYLQDFKQVHQLLGSIQDGKILDSFLHAVIGKRAMSKLPTLYAQIEQNRYLTWQTWQPIQHRYQQVAIRQELQLLLIRDIIT